MRAAMQEKEDAKTLKSKQRGKVCGYSVNLKGSPSATTSKAYSSKYI